jgi:hypothetical protein
MPRKRQDQPPDEVRDILSELQRVLNLEDATGNHVGDAECGVYAFYDYDDEPIYVGQTNEKLRVRIRRHLSNQRTDAVAMNVLDPFEVAEIEMWPLWDLTGASASESKPLLASAEFSVFRILLEASLFGAVLNEKLVAPAPLMILPDSVRGRIVPAELYERRKHPDIRIARRASTIAKLALVISERSVQPGLRTTLLTQARRLEHLARQRLEQVSDDE